MNRKIIIGVVVIVVMVPGVLMAQGEYTLEDLAAQVESLASEVAGIFSAHSDLAQRVAALETAVAPAVTLTPSPVPTPAKTKPFLTIDRRMNIRGGPGTGHDVVGVAESGMEFDITGKDVSGTWWQIVYQGESAWVYALYVTANLTEEVRVPSTPTRTPSPTFTSSPTSTVTPTRKAVRLRTATPRPGRPPLSRATRARRASPTPTPTRSGVLGSLSNPVRRGHYYLVGDWQLAVDDYDDDATRRVLTENMFNSSPPGGHRFVFVTVQARYEGEGIGDISWAFAYSLKTTGDILYETGSCGFISDGVRDAPNVLPGGEIEYNLCFVVPRNPLPFRPDLGFLMYVDPLFSFFEDGVWFEVTQR